MKRVLLICAHRRGRSPSQRYRFEQYLDYLDTQGFDFTFANLLSEKEDLVFYAKGHLLQKMLIMLKTLLQRKKELQHIGNYDLVFTQRESHFLGSTFFERGLKKKGIPFIFDFDDSIWLADTSPGNKKWEWLKAPYKLFTTAALANLVIAGNRYLAEKVRDANTQVVIIPTSIDTEIHHPIPASRNSQTVVIGWSGSISTIKHFNRLVPVLKQIQQKYKTGVLFRLLADKAYVHPELQVDSLIWSADTEVQVLNSFDIGIMPLPDDEWSRGKCGLKGLSFMACGVATVMSSVGVNVEIIEDKINGRLAVDEEDWLKILCELIENKEERQRLGDAGRLRVEARYSTTVLKPIYLECFKRALASN